ncbi:DUF3307 domain-containing protein [Nocardiopsis tropica]|uniref:DUF3307 domain-containing protein n=1 Tax=Nocardiopsis tropica TaxID=109330 RepID=A0ABU7L2D4_9ACTN|nr:DUF3307 domain-containing protein [Nocardiopsis umidischolae]MEE2055710.1 DUF3307 domain-containing protein [Nocardiopsis umidischolae]
MVVPVDVAVFAALAAASFPAHLLADHPFQSTSCAEAKGEHGRAGRAACARHVATVVAFQAAAVGLIALVGGLSLNPLAVAVGLALTGWSHYWIDRRFTAAGLWEAIGRTAFARLGAPRPDHDDNPSLGSGFYRMDQDWHTLWVALTALVMASTGLMLNILLCLTVMVMVAAILASRHGRRLLAQPS